MTVRKIQIRARLHGDSMDYQLPEAASVTWTTNLVGQWTTEQLAGAGVALYINPEALQWFTAENVNVEE